MSLLTLLSTPAAAGGGGPWSPGSIASIIDYGLWDDTTRLKQNSDGTGAVASAGDPVGWWRGQLDVLTLTQAVAANKPQYAADGIYFLGSGTNRTMACAYAAAYDAAVAMGWSEIRTVGSNKAIQIGLALNTNYNGTQTSGRAADNYLVRGVATAVAPLANAGTKHHVWSFNGSTAYALLDGVTYTLNVGANTNALGYFFLRGSTTADVKVRKWALVSSALTAGEAELLATWLGG